MSDRPRRKPNAKAHRSCGLCKPWKRIGNSRKMATRKQLTSDEVQATMKDPEFWLEVGRLANEEQRKLLDSVKVEKSSSSEIPNNCKSRPATEIHTDWEERHTDWQEDMSGHTVDTDAISQKIAVNYGDILKKLEEE